MLFKETAIREPVDIRVEQRVVELTKQGVRKVSEVKRHLTQYVKAELFRGASPPPLSRRRYFPSDKDLRNIMARARDQTRYSKIDQVNLEVRSSVFFFFFFGFLEMKLLLLYRHNDNKRSFTPGM